MRLSECLNSSDITTLRNIANAYAFDCSKSSKNALMQAIITHFQNRTFIAGTLDGLKEKEQTYRETISQLMLDSRREFSREEVLAMVRRTIQPKKEGHDQKWMNRLLSDGWLYRLNSKGGRQFYFIPEDLRRTIRECLGQSLKQQVQVAAQTPIVYRDENLALVRDTGVFLHYIGRHDTRITKDGTLMKRQQQEVFSLLEIKEEPLGKVSWRFGYGRRFHEYPDRFALIYDYCYARELIQETVEGQLILGPQAVSWQETGEKERAADLFRYWRLLYRRPIPQLRLCVNLLANAAKDDWVYAASVNALLAPYVKDYYYDKAPLVMELRIYNMLVHQGLLAHGQLADGSAVLKVTPLGRELLLQEEVIAEEVESPVEEALRVPLILQPNFDLLVPIEGAERLAWELEEVTDLIRVDTMRVHRITKSSIARCLDSGWTAETVLDFLREETGDMVPGNVERMIQQWESEFKRVQLQRALIVNCQDASIATDLKVMPEIAPYYRADLSETQFVIAERGARPLQDILRRMGYQADLH
ncbi:helicase-associated domain-containing protein [Tumebacillus permanentifrigoris]|uniref:XPB/Ssl2-like helicase family protein n=1 Tax=Tumebacillus permanentifrigoris TaxID=378543 RepID=A0A316DCR9_9BACL|nr:helicase-associated domain-containing protein [Tumebacillus permanentifrigoris]PWK15528.1 XPB/Ssl2-like helicase family protein [Tumebacillus permanentifrigoris]